MAPGSGPRQRNYIQVSLPHAANVVVYHNFSGETPVPGLTTVPEKLQPPVGPTFWGFRLMIYAAWAMFSVAFIGVIMRLRRRLFTERTTGRRPRRNVPGRSHLWEI